MSKNLFSVVIPTRQRHDTLRYSIQSVLNQTYKDFELIIMDNFSSEETSAVVFSFNDPRIKYYRSPERLSMTANWELGLSYTTGEYITIIGDDDALLPDALERCLILLNQYRVKIVSWFRWPYFWPGASTLHQRNQLFIPLEQGTGIWNSKESLTLCYQYQITYEHLPMLYNSFVNRKIIQKVKSVHGTYYPSKTISPDISSGIINAYFTDSYLYSTRFLSISGISGCSTGMSQVTLSSDPKSSTPANEFIKEFNQDYITKIIHKDLIPSFNQKIGIASDFLTMKDAFFPNDDEIRLNIRGLLTVMASEINNHPESYEKALTDIKNLAQKYGISLSELQIPPRVAVQKRTKVYHGPMRDKNGNISGLIVDCKLVGITNVAEAAMLAYGIMEGESDIQEYRAVLSDVLLKSAEQDISTVLVTNPSVTNYNILIFFLSPREAYRPIMFSTNEIFCSPDCQTTSSNGVVKTIQSQAGVFDIRQVINQLPPNQQPELIVVKTDATGRNFPINLKQYTCPKLLVLGDTHHLNRPIQTLLTYAAQENFDAIISDHDRQHLHFFREAGFQNVYWIPCLNIYPHEQPVMENKIYDVTFVGQVGRWHPNRKTVLNYLKSKGIVVNIMQAPHEQAAEIYAKSLINLNISLNGDMNLRVFEILSSGGFLLTDRLSRESGLEMIFKDGEHLVCYDSPEDLVEKIRYYLNHPHEARAIAQKGYEEYKRRHSPEVKTNELMDYIFHGRTNPLYEITLDKRSIYVGGGSRETLFARIAFYEFVQNLHLNNIQINLLFTLSVNPQILCDLSDLPRLNIYVRNNDNEIPTASLSLWCDTGIGDRVHTIGEEDIRNAQGVWDGVVMTSSDLSMDTREDFLTSVNFKLLILSDDLSSMESEQRRSLMDFLKMTGFETVSDHPIVYHWKNKAACGEYFFSKGRTADALKFFERALLDNPADEDALNNLGVISNSFKRYAAAENFFIRALQINRRNLTAMDNLIHNYIAMERFENAAELLEERIPLVPEDPELYVLLGLCHERLNHPNKAYDAYRKAREIGGDAFDIPDHMKTIQGHATVSQQPQTSNTALRRILVINNLYPPQELGGYGRLLFDFTNILRKRGHSIYVLTSDTPYLGNTIGDAPDVDRSLELFGGWQGGVCKSIENREEIIRIIRKNLSRLEQILNEFQPEACLLGNIDFLSKSIMDPMLERKIPIVHHLGNQSPGYAVAETPKSKLYQLVTASTWLKNVVIREGYSLKNVGVVYPGALVEEFHMRIPPAYDKLRIAYASIVLPYKGPHILINALKKLNDLGIDFSCSMAGTTTDENFLKQLKEFIAIHGMDDKIHFPGFLSREALKDLFARHNVLVFPSIVKEAFGISQVEAMAAGLAVITSGTGGAKEVVEHDVSGIIFKSEDDASLADALIGLVKNTQRWQSIALAGQRRALEKFDIEQSVDTLEECFKRLLKRK